MERIKNMEKFETYLCPLCYSKHTDKCSKIEWTSSLSPKQEWRLHNGECDVPEWFLIWSERVYTDAVSNREKEIAEEVPNALHEYARWILTDGKNAGPLQRRGKKKEITLQILKH